jgi:carboxypeptidase family protein
MYDRTVGHERALSACVKVCGAVYRLRRGELGHRIGYILLGRNRAHGRCLGQAIALVACAVLSMSRAGHAQGTFGVITGRIVNEVTGDALAEVNVIAWVADRFTYNEQMPYAVSQSDGSFRIENVRPGGYRISVRKAGFSVRNSANSLLVNVKPGDAVGPLQISLAPNGGVIGKVVDENDVPQTGIIVYALARNRGLSVADANPSHGHAFTDRSGRYSLRALPDGNYYLLAVAENTPETAKDKEPLAPGFYPEAALAMDAVPITVAAGQSISADIKLRRGARHLVQGSISDLPVGVSLKDVSLEMTPLDCPLRELRRTISIKPNGRFVIADVASGRYELQLTRLNERKSTVTVGREEIGVETEDVHDVSLVCFPPLVVHARAVFENGASGPTSSIVLMLHGKSAVYFERFGPNGAAYIRDLEPGQYWVGLESVPRGYYASSITVMKQETKARPIDLMGGGTVEIEVKLRTGTGTITASLDSFPAMAILAPSVLFPDRTNVQIQPVKEGVPVVFDNLPPGDYMLYSAIPLGYELWRDPDFLAAVKNWGTAVHLEENRSEQVQLSPIGENVIKGNAQRLGLRYE